MDKLSNKSWLLIEVVSSDDVDSIVKGELYDGTEFKIRVPNWAIEPIENKNPPQGSQGWLTVDYHGETNGRASITLPAPILEMGHRISVDPKTLNKLRIKL